MKNRIIVRKLKTKRQDILSLSIIIEKEESWDSPNLGSHVYQHSLLYLCLLIQQEASFNAWMTLIGWRSYEWWLWLLITGDLSGRACPNVGKLNIAEPTRVKIRLVLYHRHVNEIKINKYKNIKNSIYKYHN